MIEAALAWLLKGGWKWLGIGLLIAAVGIQTARLDHAKHDLGNARAALVNPATGHRWEADFLTADRALKSCNVNLATVTGALDRQNAAVDALKAEGERRAADTAAALERQRAATADALRRAGRIAAPIPPGPACDRVDEVDRRVLESLR